MKILYAFPEELPLKRARGVQACATAAALSQKTQVLFVAPFKKDPFTFYEIFPHNVVCFHLPRRYGLIRNTLIWAILLHLVAFKWKPHLLFIRHPKLGYYIAKLNKIPFVYEVHEILKVKHPTHPKLHLKEELLFRKARAIISVSKGLLEALKDFYSFLPPAQVIPSGTFLSPWAENKKISCTKVHDIYYLGTIHYSWKGFSVLKDALDLQPELRLHLIGASKIIHPRVKTYGWCNRSKISRLLSEAEIGVLPNTAKNIMSRHYTCPLKLLDYLGHKMAVVAADLPSVRELVSEEEVLFFEPDHPVALADALSKLSSDWRLRKQLAEAGYNHVKTYYTWDKRAESILSFLKAIGL